MSILEVVAGGPTANEACKLFQAGETLQRWRLAAFCTVVQASGQQPITAESLHPCLAILLYIFMDMSFQAGELIIRSPGKPCYVL